MCDVTIDEMFPKMTLGDGPKMLPIGVKELLSVKISQMGLTSIQTRCHKEI